MNTDKELIAPLLLVGALAVCGLLVAFGPIEYRAQAMQLLQAIIYVIIGMFGGKLADKLAKEKEKVRGAEGGSAGLFFIVLLAGMVFLGMGAMILFYGAWAWLLPWQAAGVAALGLVFVVAALVYLLS